MNIFLFAVYKYYLEIVCEIFIFMDVVTLPSFCMEDNWKQSQLLLYLKFYNIDDFDSRHVFVYELGGCGFDARCSHLNFRYHTCFEQGVPWHSGNYSV